MRRLHARVLALASLAAAWAVPRSGSAQDNYHPTPWRAQAAAPCVVAPGGLTGTELEEALAGIRGGERRGTALELIASCTVSRRAVARAFHTGATVHREAGDFEAANDLLVSALRADPSHLPARYDLARVYARRGQTRPAVEELAEISRAGPAGRRLLRGIRLEADLASVRGDENLRGLLAGEWEPLARPPTANSGVGPPPASGPTWEPLSVTDWAPFRALLTASGRFGQRTNFHPAETWAPSHPHLEGLTPFTEPAWWRPEPGVVYLVLPFRIAGPNHRHGTLIQRWTGSDFVTACFEYCRARMGRPREHEARYRASEDREVRFLRCQEEGGLCLIGAVGSRGQALRSLNGGLRQLRDVVVP